MTDLSEVDAILARIDEETACRWRLCSTQITADHPSQDFCCEAHPDAWHREREQLNPPVDAPRVRGARPTIYLIDEAAALLGNLPGTACRNDDMPVRWDAASGREAMAALAPSIRAAAERMRIAREVFENRPPERPVRTLGSLDSFAEQSARVHRFRGTVDVLPGEWTTSFRLGADPAGGGRDGQG